MAIGRRAAPTFAATSVTSGPTFNSPSDPEFFGYEPADIQSAYGTSALSASPLVAIVDAYDDPSAETDLAEYRSAFGLPDCTSANGCFTKVNQTGGAAPPGTDGAGADGWIGEISLDLDSVSAVAPKAHILLVEANSSYTSDLLVAVQEAVKLGAKYVSMSWGGSEGGLIDADGLDDAKAYAHSVDGTAFHTSGITYVASTGDDAFRYDANSEPLGGLSYPASSPNVVSAGGDALNRDATTGAFSDAAWSWDPTDEGCQYDLPFDAFQARCSGAASGCSQLEPAQSWQQAAPSLAAVCPDGRAAADVSADADPATGLLVDVEGFAEQIGGTSLAAPLLSALYAVSGETAGSVSGAVQSLAYRDPSGLIDVKSGATGDCSNALCTAGTGWDGPTGLGAPNSPADLAYVPKVTATWPSFRYGTASAVKVTVSASIAPTGTVTLKNGTVTVASKALSGTGTTRTATLSVPGTKLTPGSHKLTVVYSGAGRVAPAKLTHTVSVAKAVPAVTTIWPTFKYGAASTVKVTVKSTVTPASTGTVSVKWGTKALAIAKVPSGTATTKTVNVVVHTSTLTAGSRPLTVSYSGDADIAAKTLAAHTLTVAKAVPTVTATWPASIHFASPFSVKVKVSASGIPTGTVSLKSGTKLLKSVKLPTGTATSKQVTLSVAAGKLSRGGHKLTVSYSGDANVTARTLAAHSVTVR